MCSYAARGSASSGANTTRPMRASPGTLVRPTQIVLPAQTRGEERPTIPAESSSLVNSLRGVARSTVVADFQSAARETANPSWQGPYRRTGKRGHTRLPGRRRAPRAVRLQLAVSQQRALCAETSGVREKAVTTVVGAFQEVPRTRR